MKAVFIGGCPRSGTTLLGAMLGGHPRHLTVPEMTSKIPILAGSHVTPDALQAFGNDWRLRLWGIDAIVSVTSGVAPREFFERLARTYGTAVGKPAPDVWIDHTPTNIRLATAISRVFPEAHIIHLVRDGRAVAASMLRLDWGPNDIARAARYWAQYLAHGLAAESAPGVVPVTRVRYEDLVAAPTPTLTRLCAALGIEYDPEMVRARGFRPPAYATTTHSLVGTAPDASRAAAWRMQLTQRQVEIFESVASDLLLSLGYDVDFGLAARPASARERFASNLRHLAKGRIDKQRGRQRRNRAIRAAHSSVRFSVIKPTELQQ